MNTKTLNDIQVQGKTVLVRVDFNVPVKDGVVGDTNRIVQALPTIKHIIENGGKAVLFSHLGRVKTEEDLETNSMRPVAQKLSDLIEKPVKFLPATRGVELETAVKELEEGEILLFENTRFEDLNGKKESGNDEELAKYWASLGDVFVNDAFGTAHRAHASNVGISKNLESVAGFLLEKEIKYIGGAVDNPNTPFVAILGGSKVSDKIGVIEYLLEKADKVLIGGGMMFTFLKAKGYNVGTSLCEDDKVELAKELMEKAGDKLVLPIDAVAAAEFNESSEPVYVEDLSKFPEDKMGLDIGPKSVELFTQALEGAKTVVWNGPMGVSEWENFAAGTVGVCTAIAELEDANTIIGGGDSAAAAAELGFADKFSHISTGGGASLEYLEGKELPGVVALAKKD